MRLRTLIEATRSYRLGLREAETDSDYISAAKAMVIARDVLLRAGFVQVGRSNQSESCYLARPGSTRLRICCAVHEPVHDAATEGIVASLVFTDRHKGTIEEWGEVEGERLMFDTHNVVHTGLNKGDIEKLVSEAIQKYDAARVAENKRTKPLAAA